MKFYNRASELAQLKQIEDLSHQSAQMTFVIGRRRIGKTSLLLEAYRESPQLYFFIAKKNEALLCQEFAEEMKQKLQIPLFGEFKTFKVVFGLLLEIAKTRQFTLIIDEFQEFNTVNAAIFSDMQNLWDASKRDAKINLLLCGSVYSMMTRIFENAKEPLFGRATHKMHLKSFDVGTLKEILTDYHPQHSGEDLLAFYLITGGVAKYVELLVSQKAFTKTAMLAQVLRENSLFLEEGKNVLIEEFGKEYGNYFSILSLIASGKTSRVEIESIMEIQTGGFLERLESSYGLIHKVRPILAKPTSRVIKYAIADNFLSFWFRFIYKYRSAIEAGNIEYIAQIVDRDYDTYSGKILEKYFIEKLKREKKYNLIGTYWEKNNENEIDIVAVNDIEKKVLFCEVKRKANNIDLGKLKAKSAKLLPNFQGYQGYYQGYSLEDI
jgi:AAA+ ATPase superfamily predicted ATPase